MSDKEESVVPADDDKVTLPPAEPAREETLEEEPGEPLVLEQPRVNIVHHDDLPIDVPYEGKDKEKGIDPIAILRESQLNIERILEHYDKRFSEIEAREKDMEEDFKKKGKTITDGDGNLWFRTMVEAQAFAQLDHMGLKASQREGSQWDVGFNQGGTFLHPGSPRQSLGAGNHTNDELLSFLTKRAGVGTTFDFPLWHSGLWLRFRSPALTDIAAMNHELSQVRVNLGAETKGMGFSNTAQVMLNIAVNWALQFVIEANVQYNTASDLEAMIDSMDAPLVLLGMASTMYPGGLPYAMACVSDPDTCQHIRHAKLKVHLLNRVDTSRLTEEQKRHMAKRFNMRPKMTSEDIAKYKTNPVKYVWFNDIGLRLSTPTLAAQREAGHDWIDGLTQMTTGAFNEPPSGSNRNRYISQLGRHTSARQYAHWVDAVVMKDDEAPDGIRVLKEDKLFINQFLDKVMSDDQYIDDFFDEVRAFIEESMVAMVAIPSYNCTQCGTPAADKFHERFEHLIPLDMLTLFFILANRKLN